MEKIPVAVIDRFAAGRPQVDRSSGIVSRGLIDGHARVEIDVVLHQFLNARRDALNGFITIHVQALVICLHLSHERQQLRAIIDRGLVIVAAVGINDLLIGRGVRDVIVRGAIQLGHLLDQVGLDHGGPAPIGAGGGAAYEQGERRNKAGTNRRCFHAAIKAALRKVR